MTARSKWPFAVVGLLAVNVVAAVTLAVLANRGGAQVIPDYYAKATHYDDELSRSATSRALGWRVDVTLTGRRVEATVADAAGQPIEAARVRITGYQRAHASDRIDVELTAGASGHYRGVVPGRPGWYDLVASAERGDAHFTRRLVVEAK
ncbi:MAG: FixH family protein [Kofleriaceae bacterium]